MWLQDMGLVVWNNGDLTVLVVLWWRHLKLGVRSLWMTLWLMLVVHGSRRSEVRNLHRRWLLLRLHGFSHCHFLLGSGVVLK